MSNGDPVGDTKLALFGLALFLFIGAANGFSEDQMGPGETDAGFAGNIQKNG